VAPTRTLTSMFNIKKGLPIGALTYGLGGLAGRSVVSLAKDLRQRLSDPTMPDWNVDPGHYSVEEIAIKMRKYFFEELYAPQFAASAATAPLMGFLVGGFSSGERNAEVWEIQMDKGKCDTPRQMAAATPGWAIQWQGEGEALTRLVRGWSADALNKLVAAGMDRSTAETLLDSVRPMMSELLPIQDAIDLVHYLIDVTCGFVRFSPGNATVAQPIDSAAITPHEGFRWIRRKHYYSATLNTPSARELP